MFDWLMRPTCPCDPAAKKWVEKRLDWLAEQFDDSAFSGRRLVLPTPEFFPDPYDASNKAVRLLLERVCEYMDVDPDRIKLEFVSDAGKIWLVDGSGQYVAQTAGTYEQITEYDGDGEFEAGDYGELRRATHSLVRIDKQGLHNTMELVGTIAHELAHVRLMGEERVDPDIYDNELLTDLTVVHFGLGVFLANVPRNWDSQYTSWPGTKLKKPEYMTPPMFGWALAHLAWHRGEDAPKWSRHLNSGARANFKQGLRYLRATGDSTYKPVRDGA
jgi:hypothetical protein